MSIFFSLIRDILKLKNYLQNINFRCDVGIKGPDSTFGVQNKKAILKAQAFPKPEPLNAFQIRGPWVSARLTVHACARATHHKLRGSLLASAPGFQEALSRPNPAVTVRKVSRRCRTSPGGPNGTGQQSSSMLPAERNHCISGSRGAAGHCHPDQEALRGTWTRKLTFSVTKSIAKVQRRPNRQSGPKRPAA